MLLLEGTLPELLLRLLADDLTGLLLRLLLEILTGLLLIDLRDDALRELLLRWLREGDCTGLLLMLL